jgi:hypothetical protein
MFVAVIGVLADMAELPQPAMVKAIAPAQSVAERDMRAA